MDDIENIIKRYQQELLDFSYQNQSAVPHVIPTLSPQVRQEPAPETFIENPQPVVEQETKRDVFPRYSTYDEFLRANTEEGLLRVQVFGGNQFFPISGARVRVSLPLANGSDIQQFDGLTDINGVVDNIPLPAPPNSLSQTPDPTQVRPFAYYTILIEHPRYASSRFLNVPVFSEVKSVQNVQLVPLVGTGETPDTTIQFQTEPFLNIRGLDENGNTDRS
ncbi:MAG: hypothetical protein IJZ88_01515 [Clostridia bacterium]|nr:hypothetical protein [Clostridia bacterium]